MTNRSDRFTWKDGDVPIDIPAGFYPFVDADGKEWGQFELYYFDGFGEAAAAFDKVGWYWMAGHPGMFYGNSPSGPFPTAREAYEDAPKT